MLDSRKWEVITDNCYESEKCYWGGGDEGESLVLMFGKQGVSSFVDDH